MLKQAGLSSDIIQCFYEIDNRIISEIKSVKASTDEPEFSRKVYNNERKK
ncbi:MAG: hypothetical protein K9N09_06105 [Candidatus Cloacimonetes bacterium]|nr:hypothetical protein [Candidatus Cloacimonadota bacterium]MCF7868257.1 hypothetical protein [Candidatus Cloacimonadota bacterium]MCF7883769.1 hypothetical protein [Candidatus Cloacimonadota bacterium]